MAEKPTYQELEQRIQKLERALSEKIGQEKQRGRQYLPDLDAILEGCQLISTDWRYLYINHAAARHARKTKEELIGRKMGEVFPGFEATELFQALRLSMNSRKIRQVENQFTFPDGRTGWFKLSIQPVPEGLFIMSIDITERKLTQIALRKNRERLIQAQRIARMGDFTWDVGTGEVTWSEALFELLGYEKTEDMDYVKVNREVHHPDDLAEVTGWLRECIESGRDELTPKEYRLVRKDGKTIQIRTVGKIARQKDGSVKVFATVQDISGIRHAEKALRESEARYRNLFMNSPDAVIVNTGERIALVNQACVELFGCRTPDELIGKPILELIHPDYHQTILSAIERMDRHEPAKIPIEHKIIRRDGQVLDVEVVAAPFTFKGEEAIHVIIHDLTERNRALDEKENLQSQLIQAQKMESIGLLAGGVAHDFNNLLAIILGYGGLLKDCLGHNEEGQTYLQAIMEAGHKAEGLVGQLLAFSRKQALVVKPVDLNRLLAGFEKLLRRTIPEHINLTVYPLPKVIPVLADAGQLEQVVMNIAVNAVDAMPDGGALTIETKAVELDARYAASHLNIEPGNYVMLSVSDTGFGMDKETRKHIFDPFFSTKGDKGTGLGLATSYGIVRQHKGHIWVYSEPGRGTTFKIYLPLAEGAAAPSISRPERVSSAQGSETILLVEDDQELRRIVRITLEAHGYKVMTAANGEEAMAKLQGNLDTVQLLLTDVIMPGMNGKMLYQQCQRILPGLKVLYMSGYTDNVIAHHGVLDPGVNFLQKPFSRESLTMRIRGILDEAPATAQGMAPGAGS